METTLFLLSFGECHGTFRAHVNSPICISTRLLPDWVPFHPYRWWIHTRTVYVPMSYLYGVRYKAEENDLILSLRKVY